MKKWWVLVLCTCILGLSAPATAFGRAGGATGGTTTGETEGTTSSPSSYHQSGYYGYNNGQNLVSGLVIGAVAIFMGGSRLKKRADQRNAPHDVYPIEPEIARQFEPLFYRVEQAWSDGDQATLASLMTPRYFHEMKRLLDRWQAAGKINRLEGMVIIKLEAAPSTKETPHVVVTAQARDYFEYPGKSPEYNRNQYDQTRLERFVEVWELQEQSDGRYLVAKIRQ